MPTTMSQFYRAHDIDPTVVTVKVGRYQTLKSALDIFTTEYQPFMDLCGEYWFSRKTSAYVYRPLKLYDNSPQPADEWLIDNRPSIKDLRRYGQVTP